MILSERRFGVEGSGIKYNAYALWGNWTGVQNWVCGYQPLHSTVVYDCIPEVSRGLIKATFDSNPNSLLAAWWWPLMSTYLLFQPS